MTLKVPQAVYLRLQRRLCRDIINQCRDFGHALNSVYGLSSMSIIASTQYGGSWQLLVKKFVTMAGPIPALVLLSYKSLFLCIQHPKVQHN
jgi:hypothetical protein